MEDIKIKRDIELYKIKAHNIFDHMIMLLKLKEKYVFSEACESNLNLYFSYYIKIKELERKLKKENIKEEEEDDDLEHFF